MKQGSIPISGPLSFTRFGWLILILLNGFQPMHAQVAEVARKVVEDLAGPYMYGRGFVHNGADRAARYITRSFRRNGANPLNGSYSQAFRLDVNTFPGTVNLSVDGTLLNPVTDYLPDPCSPGLTGRFGIIEINADDILSGNVLIKLRKATKGHLLYLNFPDKDSLDPGLKKEIQGFMAQMRIDAATEASGIIEVTEKKLWWSSARTACSKPWIIVNKAVDLDSLSHLEVSIKNRFITGRKTRNILGAFKGTQKPDSFVLFTAHYDHIGALGRNYFFPGANDNASGVAMLLSLMNHYAEHPPAWSVLFLATTAEELGLLGSSYFVGNSPIDLDKIRFLINFDLAGTGEEGIMVVNAGEYPEEFKLLAGINKNESLIPVIKTRKEACISDHCPFHQRGVPCFYLYTLGGSPAYHNLNDTPDAISLAAFENYRKLVIRFVEEL